jgi:hypothetical protein
MKFALFCSLVFLIINIGFSYSQTPVDVTPCINGNWGMCGIAVGKLIYGSLTRWNDRQNVKFLGKDCVGRVKGGWHRWQWKWSGQFSCNGWSVMGTSTQRKSRNGAVEHAVIDFMQQALNAKLISVEDIKTLNQIKG